MTEGFRFKLIEYLGASDLDNLDRCGICDQAIPDDVKDWRCILREPYEGIKLGVEHYLMAHAECTKDLPKGASVEYVKGKTAVLHKRFKDKYLKRDEDHGGMQDIVIPSIGMRCSGSDGAYFSGKIVGMVRRRRTPFKSLSINIEVAHYHNGAPRYEFDATTRTLTLRFIDGERSKQINWNEIADLL